MKRIDRRCMRLGAMVLALTALAVASHAATLPPPPASPAPVRDYEYDAKGNPTKVIKAKGVSGFGFTTSGSYDSLDRIKSSTDARSGVTTLGYDGRDQLMQVTDPRNLVTSYQRNGLGDLTQLSSPDTGTANSTYDEVGNLLTRADSRGVLATYSYDSLNRMTSAVYTKAGQTTQTYGWTYDQTGADFGAGIGRLTTAASPDVTTKYGYDALGRVTVVTQAVSTVAHTTRYGYDGAGHVTSITYPSGRVLTIAYSNGVPVSMSVAKDASSAANPLINGVQWEPFGGVRSWQMALSTGAMLQERVYDQYGRLVRYPLGAVVRDITYDAADRIVSYTHMDSATGQLTAEAQALNQSFGYDELGRLTSISTPSASWTIGYDANGNRTGVTLNGAASTYTTEATSNRLSGISNPTRGFGYDAAGNTLSDTGIAYAATYGLDNRLTTLTKAGVTTFFNYDAAGQRVRKVTGTSKPHFVYDQDGQLLGEYDSSGKALQEFVWLGGTLIAVLTNSSMAEPRVYFAYSDHLNAPRVIVNAAGDVRWKWFSEPFGTTVPETIPNSLENLVVNLRFPGQYFDKESGLSYNYFRDYDGTTGRYAQSDPIGLEGGINTYAYVGGNPLSNVDPNGQQATLTWCFGGPWGCAAGVAATGWAIWMATPSGKDAVQNAASSASKTEQCKPECDAAASRSEAMVAAYSWAGISIGGAGSNPIPWSNFNMPAGMSRGGREYGEFMRTYYPKNYGYSTPAGASVVEHPFGHPDQPGPAHHACPHFHAKNSAGVEQIFTYKPGS